MKMSLKEFKRMFWTSGQFYRNFVQFSLGDENIHVSPWTAKDNEVIAGQKYRTINRVINSKHPLAFKFPVTQIMMYILPIHNQCKKNKKKNF